MKAPSNGALEAVCADEAVKPSLVKDVERINLLLVTQAVTIDQLTAALDSLLLDQVGEVSAYLNEAQSGSSLEAALPTRKFSSRLTELERRVTASNKVLETLICLLPEV
jgi:uncharacterized coiled-coil protein SlyX